MRICHSFNPNTLFIIYQMLSFSKQAFREFIVSLALINNLKGHKSVELSHDKCKILTYFVKSFICSL